MTSSLINPEIIRGRLTEAEKRRIDELAERLSSGQIAMKLNRHPGTISFYMIVNGLRKARRTKRGPFTRGGRTVVPFSREEDAFITALRVQDYSTPKIAELSSKRFGTNRNAGTIRVRLSMLASMEEEA